MTDFSSHHIHSEYQRLNEMDYLHSGEEGLDEEDFEPPEVDNWSILSETVPNVGQFACINDLADNTGHFDSEERDSASNEEKSQKTP